MQRSERIFFFCCALIIWFAVITQLYLMLQNRVTPAGETMIRFFSYFTILTNTLAALYCTLRLTGSSVLSAKGTLTAITVYIFVVGAVYQAVLRPLWQPEGMQKIVDELLHSVNPLLILAGWYFFEKKKAVQYRQVPYWLIYPLVYLVLILLRGSFSGFYPYPFVNADKLGLQQVLLNSAVLLVVFTALSLLLIRIGKSWTEKN